MTSYQMVNEGYVVNYPFYPKTLHMITILCQLKNGSQISPVHISSPTVTFLPVVDTPMSDKVILEGEALVTQFALEIVLVGPQSEGKAVLSIYGNSFKAVGKTFLMKLVERMPRVCKAVIKAKGGHFEEYQIYFDLFNTFFGYYVIPYVLFHSFDVFTIILQQSSYVQTFDWYYIIHSMKKQVPLKINLFKL